MSEVTITVAVDGVVVRTITARQNPEERNDWWATERNAKGLLIGTVHVGKESDVLVVATRALLLARIVPETVRKRWAALFRGVFKPKER